VPTTGKSGQAFARPRTLPTISPSRSRPLADPRDASSPMTPSTILPHPNATTAKTSTTTNPTAHPQKSASPRHRQTNNKPQPIETRLTPRSRPDPRHDPPTLSRSARKTTHRRTLKATNHPFTARTGAPKSAASGAGSNALASVRSGPAISFCWNRNARRSPAFHDLRRREARETLTCALANLPELRQSSGRRERLFGRPACARPPMALRIV